MLCSSAILPGEEEPSPPCLSPTSLDISCSNAPCVPGPCTRCLLDVDNLRHAAPRGGRETRSPAQPALIPQQRASKLPVPLGLAEQEGRLSPSLSLILAKTLSSWLLGYARFLPISSFILCLFPCRDGKRSRDKSCPLAIFQGIREQWWLLGCCEGRRPRSWLLSLCSFPSGSRHSYPLGHWGHTLLGEELLSGPWESAQDFWDSLHRAGSP